jgi:hypothetical protein
MKKILFLLIFLFASILVIKAQNKLNYNEYVQWMDSLTKEFSKKEFFTKCVELTNVNNHRKHLDCFGKLSIDEQNALINNVVTLYNQKEYIQESETLQATEWVAGRKTSGEAVNHYLYTQSRGYNPDNFKPPYKIFTQVEDVTIPVGQKVYCVEYLNAEKPGGWLCTKPFSSLEEARNELALLEDFKSNKIDDIVIREYTVKKAFNTRQGIVGELRETDGTLRQGGATQIEFGGRNNPFGNNVIWKEYLEEVNGERTYVKKLN